eukprot:Gb_03277 [translate_table: standard]
MDEDDNSHSPLPSTSFSSSEMDSSVSSSSSTRCWDDGPLYHMNSLKPHLPCKRGLSQFFDGKSQTFSSLADVKCVEELGKRENSFKCSRRKKKLKASHTYHSAAIPDSYSPTTLSNTPHMKPSIASSKAPLLSHPNHISHQSLPLKSGTESTANA